MLNVYQCLRYIVFGIFIVSSAVIASVAVWNISLLQVLGLNLPVVSYLIFVGSLGLAFIFAVIFIELARRNAVTGRVLFELCWVSLFLILELAGAIAYSAIVPSKMCSKKATKISGSCLSTQVLQAFTLIITITLFGYLSVLLMSCLRHGRFAWQSNIRDLVALPRERERADISSRFLDRGGTIVAPQPLRPHPDWTYRSGLNPDYEIEHYQPPAAPMPTVSSSHRQNWPPAFYPQVVQSSLTTQPLPFSTPEAEQSNMSPPLGDWPRMDILQQPTRPRKLPVPFQEMETSPRRRPTGPRKQSEERRPPPLDLSKITSFKNMPP